MSFFWHNCLRIYTSVFTLSYFSSINLIWAFKISNWEFKEVSTWLDSWDGLPPCEISLWIGIILAFLHSLYSYEIVTWGFPSSFRAQNFVLFSPSPFIHLLLPLSSLIHGLLWWWASSRLIFSLKWRLLSIFLLHSAAIYLPRSKGIHWWRRS